MTRATPVTLGDLGGGAPVGAERVADRGQGLGRELARERTGGAAPAGAQRVHVGLRELTVAQRLHAVGEEPERLAQPLGRERLDEVVDDAEVHALAHDRGVRGSR